MNNIDKITKIYNEDLRELIDELKSITKDERMELYTFHTKRLFKRIITIEELLNDNVKANREKFRHCFMIICEDFFSTNYFGEYNQELFIRETGYKSQRYPQKVILALSLMGYITRMIRSYSVGNHGYQYEVDYWKFKKWDTDFFIDVEFERNRNSSPVICQRGLFNKSYSVIHF